MVRLGSLFLVFAAAAVLTVGCGQGSLMSPTGPTGTIGSGALTSDATALAASDDAAFTTLERGHGKGPDEAKQPEGKKPEEKKPEDKKPEDKKPEEKKPEGEQPADNHGPGNHGEITGLVTAVSATSLTVNGMTVNVTADTEIRHGHRMMTMADIAVGDRVQVRGTTTGTAFTATEIKVEDTGNDNDDDGGVVVPPATAPLKGIVSLLTGTCPALSLTVGTTKVTTTATTVFDDVTCATLANGAIAEVEGAVQADGSVIATKVEKEAGPDEVVGLVSALAGTCATSLTFTVGTTHVTANATTVFTGVTCAALINGASVEVEGTKQPDLSIAAASVELK
jgi:hypothetical protein